MNTALIFQMQSILIVCVLLIGVYLRQNRKAHVKLMGLAIVWDILLILQIELSRGAIKKASHAISNPMMLNIHISIAVLTVLLYFGMIYTGRKLLRNENEIRPLHKKLGWTTLLMRIATLVTSYWAVATHQV